MNNCPQATGTQSGVTVPGPSGGSPDNTVASLSNATGCTSVDQTFNNFGLANTGSGPNGQPTAASTYLFETPTGSVFNPLTTPTVLTYSTLRGTSGGTADTFNNFDISPPATSTVTTDIFNLVTVGNGHKDYAIILNLTDYSVSLLGSMSIEVTVCSGGAVTGTAFTSCTGGGNPGGTMFQQTFTVPANTSNAGTVNLGSLGLGPTGTSSFYMDTRVTVRAGIFDSSLVTFSEGFQETPEPSTYLLSGSALLGLAGLRLFRSRKARNRPAQA